MYKKIISVALFFLIVFFMSYSVSFGGGQVKALVDEHSFKIGFDVRNFKYEEDLMEEEGIMYGLLGEYTYHGISGAGNNLMANVSLEYSSGELDYDGETWGGEPVTADTEDWIMEFRGLIGYEYGLKDWFLISPFLGLGYRYWNDEIKGTGGYERETNYLYIPIGIKTISHLFGKWTWEASAEYDLFLRGKVKSHLSDVDPGLNDPEVDQDDGYGLRASLRFKREIFQENALIVQPHIRYWDIDKSDEVTLTYNNSPTGYYVYEPENETTSYGLRLVYKW